MADSTNLGHGKKFHSSCRQVVAGEFNLASVEGTEQRVHVEKVLLTMLLKTALQYCCPNRCTGIHTSVQTRVQT